MLKYYQSTIIIFDNTFLYLVQILLFIIFSNKILCEVYDVL